MKQLLALASFALAAAPGFAQTIVLDPGHPSETSAGTTGRHISERTLVWRVALKLKPMLLEAGYQVVLTKDREEQKVTNRRRAEIANEAKADLMLRLHADAGNFRGFATYFPNRQATKDGVKGPPMAMIRKSTELARPFHDAAVKALGGKLRDHGLYPESKTAVAAKQGALTGSIFSKVPTLLVELCVLTNPKDEAVVKTEAGQTMLAKALLAGIKASVPRRARAGT